MTCLRSTAPSGKAGLRSRQAGVEPMNSIAVQGLNWMDTPKKRKP